MRQGEVSGGAALAVSLSLVTFEPALGSEGPRMGFKGGPWTS